MKKRWEASQERQAFRDSPAHTWRCLYCHAELQEGEQCPVPACVVARAAARKRMGVK